MIRFIMHSSIYNISIPIYRYYISCHRLKYPTIFHSKYNVLFICIWTTTEKYRQYDKMTPHNSFILINRIFSCIPFYQYFVSVVCRLMYFLSPFWLHPLRQCHTYSVFFFFFRFICLRILMCIIYCICHFYLHSLRFI